MSTIKGKDMKRFVRLVMFVSVVGIAAMLASCGSDASDRGRNIGESVEAALRNINGSDTLFRMDNGDDADVASTVVTVARDSSNTPIPGNGGIVVNVYEDSAPMNFDSFDLVPIVAIICSFGCPILIVLLVMIYIYKIYKDRNRVIEMAVQRGVAISPEIFYRGQSPRRRLNIAMTWLGVGLGVVAMAWIIDSSGLMGVGCVPSFIGLGKLVTYLLEDRKENTGDTDNIEARDAE